MEEQHQQIGPTTQDDPMPYEYQNRPEVGAQGGRSLIAVFEDVDGATACAEDLERKIPGLDVGVVARRGDGPEQGLRPGNVITGPGTGNDPHDGEEPPKNKAMGAGVAVGATIGATVGLLAATYWIPPFGPLVATPTMVSTLVGAGLGSFVGGFAEYGMTEKQDDASIYPGEVRKGGVLLLVRADPDQEAEVRQVLQFWNPLEIREQ